MRTAIVILVVCGCACLARAGKLPPLAVKDVSLMLRSGYSVSAVQAEIATRHFIGSLDSASEKALLQAGATPAFIELLKSGAYAVPREELEAVQEEIKAAADRRELQAAAAQKLDSLYQSQQAQNKPIADANTGKPFADLVKGDLVTSKNGILQVFNDQAFERKKLIALYFSAHWCPPCRKFTPQLVEYYNRVAPDHPEFEIVFVSLDRSGPAMEAYMRDSQMPWPALKYEKVMENLSVQAYAGPGIPCLVLIDASGKVISNSYSGKTYRGPAAVVADLEKIFAGEPIQVAQEP